MTRRACSIVRLLALMTVFALLVPIGACDPMSGDKGQDTFVLEGTVQFSQIEGGCWFIVDAGQQNFQPVNWTSNLQTVGLKVRLVVKPADGASICQVGTLVEIVRILEIEPPPASKP